MSPIADYVDLFDILWAGICAGFVWFFGKADGLLFALITFVCLDYATGILAAAIEHKLSSSVGYKGIARKCVMFMLVGMAHVIDKQFAAPTEAFRDIVIVFYCANEGMSILENADVLGMPLPQALKNLFENMRNKDDNDDNDDNTKRRRRRKIKRK